MKRKYYKATRYMTISGEIASRYDYIKIYPGELFTFSEISVFNPEYLISEGLLEVVEVKKVVTTNTTPRRRFEGDVSEVIVPPYVKAKDRINHLKPTPPPNKEIIELKDLLPGETYYEIFLEEEGEGEEVIILHNSPGLLIAYLSGAYDIKEDGKKLLIELGNKGPERISNFLESIPDEEYRRELPFLYNKYGFFDEGIIFYDNFKDSYTVDNEYVGLIQFTKST